MENDMGEQMPDDQHPICEHEQKFRTMLETLNDHEDRLRMLEKNQNFSQVRIEHLTTLVDEVKVILKGMTSTFESKLLLLMQQVELLKSKPAMRWDSVTDTAIKLIIGAAITYIASRLLK